MHLATCAEHLAILNAKYCRKTYLPFFYHLFLRYFILILIFIYKLTVFRKFKLVLGTVSR